MPASRLITIESILGGHSPATHFAGASQFMTSLGIDPGLPGVSAGPMSYIASGLIRPVPATNGAGATLQGVPLWIKSQPKVSGGLLYVYDSQGSAYTSTTLGVLTALSDAGALSNATGNGMEYYDNYLYFAKNTTVARYGPLNGSPKFDADYWVTTLSKTALVHTPYPTNSANSLAYPNHVMKRHSDGRLYFCDVVGNRGVLHYIATKNTTVEGDTDDSSTYNKLQFGCGLWPTALESYGSDLVIALFESDISTTTSQKNAKIGFWDTLSTNFNQIVWVEFPDSIISAMKNINGVLYVISGDVNRAGFRVSQYVGGYTFKEVIYFDTGASPFPGGVDGRSNQLVFASNTQFPETAPCIYSIGLSKSKLGQGVFNIMRGTSTDPNVTGTAIAFSEVPTNENNRVPLFGWGRPGVVGIDGQGSVYNNAPSVWWSQMFRIGQNFKITKIRILLAQSIAANMTLIPTVYVDESSSGTALTTINSTNYPNGEKNIVLRPINLTGQHSFWLELRWTGSALCTVALPITIEYEPLNDQ